MPDSTADTTPCLIRSECGNGTLYYTGEYVTYCVSGLTADNPGRLRVTLAAYLRIRMSLRSIAAFDLYNTSEREAFIRICKKRFHEGRNDYERDFATLIGLLELEQARTPRSYPEERSL